MSRFTDVVLSLWRARVLSDAAVIELADAEMLRQERPEHELIELSLLGPVRYCEQTSETHPRPDPVPYLLEFSLRAAHLNCESPEDTYRFAEWAARASLGEDTRIPEVSFGYEADAFLAPYDDPAPMSEVQQFVMRFVPALLPECRARTEAFTRGVAQQTVPADGLAAPSGRQARG